MKRIFLIFSLAFFLPLSVSFAGTQHNMTGWAWSSNVGWISFNCTNISLGACSSIDYGVTVDNAGLITGFAWSPYVGWIQFGGLSGFPTGTGTYPGNAEKNGSTLRGWARALTYGDGWDGWISLNGSDNLNTNPYGVVASSSGAFIGFGWGSTVLGWTSFDNAGADGVRLGGGANLVVKSSGVSLSSDQIVPYNSNIELEYDLINMPVGQTCALTKTSPNGTPFTAISGIASSSSAFTGPLGTNGVATTTYAYDLNCTNGQDSSFSFKVAPEVAGFSLGSQSSVGIEFLSMATTTSKFADIEVGALGGFSGNITLSLSPLTPTVDASTTVLYFLGDDTTSNKTYSLSPTANLWIDGNATSTARAGTKLQILVSKPFSGTKQLTVTGVSGSISKTTVIDVNPDTTNLNYQEF